MSRRLEEMRGWMDDVVPVAQEFTTVPGVIGVWVTAGVKVPVEDGV